MAVVYLDQTATGKGAFAQALGQSIAQGLYQSVDQQATSNALAQAKNMDPQARTAYLVSKLGPQGAKLADQLTQSQLDGQAVSLNALKIVDQKYQNTVDQVSAANAPATAALALKIQTANVAKINADTIASKASAAYDMAGAAAAQAQAGLYKVQASLDQQRFNVLAGTMAAISALGQTNGDPAAAAQKISDDPHIPAGQNGNLAPQLPGAPKENTDVNSLVQQGQAVLGYQLGTVNQQSLNAAFPPDNITPQLTSGNANQAKLDLLGGKYEDAGKALNTTKPLSVKVEERAPGVYQTYAIYPDGTGQWTGRPVVQLKPTPQKDLQFAQGEEAWKATTAALSTLYQLNPGTRITRSVRNMLVNHGVDPSDIDMSGGDVSILINTTLAHATLAARNIAGAGGSIGYKNLQLITDTLPKPGDDPNIAAAKLNAAQALIDTAVKPMVMGLAANGMVVPPTLIDTFNQRDLLHKDVDALASGYTIGEGAPEGSGNPLNPAVSSGNPGATEGEDDGGTPDDPPSAAPSTASGNDSTSPSTDGWGTPVYSDSNQ